MRILAPLVATATLLSCAAGGSKDIAASWSGWQRVENAYAERFDIWRKGGDRVLLVFGDSARSDTLGVYWVRQEASGQEPPIPGLVIEKKITAVAVGSTTHVPYISCLGRLPAIKACAHLGQVRDTAFIFRAGSGLVQEIATGDGLDREVLVNLKPQALLSYPFGRKGASALDGIGIPTIEVSEYLEEHPLGRAEWLRFFGVLFDEERKADSLFTGIRERYEALRVDSATIDRPTVLFGSVWDGQWWVPPGNSYMARLIEDAGGRYIFADRNGEGNIAIDMETMVATASQAECWGMIAQLDTLPSVRDFTNDDERLIAFRSVKDQRMFLGNTRVSDLFGQALLEPDRVLGDLKWCLRDQRVISCFKIRTPYFSPLERNAGNRTVDFSGADQ